MYTYRDDQQDIHDRLFQGYFDGFTNQLVVSDVGTGKTVIISNVVREMMRRYPNKPIVVIAHRQELVSQISLSLAENGLSHSLICGKTTEKFIIKRHVKKYKRSFIKYGSPVKVASVKTLNNCKQLDFSQVAFWVIDEAHHVLRTNQWGKCVERFTNALGMGVTATPIRADGRGLGAWADGVFENIVQNKYGMIDQIIMGRLSRFVIYAPPSNLQIDESQIGASGDYSQQKLSKATKRSNIIHGDVVKSYLKYAPGKLGITFVPDVEIGEIITKQFNQASVPTALIHSKTSDKERAELIDKFERREILQLVNVDIFGEGFNLPAIEVVQFARKTASYALYVQQFGRSLRTLDGKEYAIIIDHVGNVSYHGLPTQQKDWSLDRRERKRGSTDNSLKTKTCYECSAVYPAYHISCPACGYEHVPEPASSPEIVDGDLALVDFSHIDELHKQIANINRELTPVDLPNRAGIVAVNSVKKSHRQTREAQEELRHAMALWSGHHITNFTLRERQKLFYMRFGYDVLTAQTLRKKEAQKLLEKVLTDM